MMSDFEKGSDMKMLRDALKVSRVYYGWRFYIQVVGVLLLVVGFFMEPNLYTGVIVVLGFYVFVLHTVLAVLREAVNGYARVVRELVDIVKGGSD